MSSSPFRMPRRAVSLFALLVISCAIFASPSARAQSGKPAIILLHIAETDAARTREAEFSVQLELALDRFDVIPIREGLDGFSRAQLARRLSMIKPHAQRLDAIATVWIEEPSRGLVLLNLVALGTGRALVRIVESSGGPDAALELALAAEELLGEAYLLSRAPREPAVEQLVTDVTRTAVSTLAAPGEVLGHLEPTAEQSPFSISFAGVSRLGFSGGIGRGLDLGGALGADARIVDHVHVRLALSLASGLQDRGAWGTASSFVLEPAVGVGLLFAWGRFTLGPIIDIGADRREVRIDLETTGGHEYHWWTARLAAGLHTRLALTRVLSICLEPTLGATPKRREFWLDPGETRIYRTPLLDFGLALGLVFRI